MTGAVRIYSTNSIVQDLSWKASYNATRGCECTWDWNAAYTL